MSSSGINTELINEQKIQLTKLGYVYNPSHETFQKIKYITEGTRSFYNVAFHTPDEELWITNTVHSLQDSTKYYMYILFLGKIPKSVENFNTIVNSITLSNKVVDNSMVRYLRKILEKNSYNLIEEKEYELDHKGEIKSFLSYKYCKEIGEFDVMCQIELPTNKMWFQLINEEENTKISLLDSFIPATISELSIVLNHVPTILHDPNQK